jgi:hypothetical protein
MAQVVLDTMDDASAWSTFEPDGVTPSSALSRTVDTATFHHGEDRASLRVIGTTGASQHRLSRAIASLDLQPFDEIRLAIRGDRLASTAPGRPFYLELRLGSAAAPSDTVANPWHRLLPVDGNRWQVIRLSLADLPNAARSAADRIQLRCVDASLGFTVFLDDLIACRHEPSVDVDAALLRRLHNHVELEGQPVPAQVHVAGAALPSTRPLILIHPYAARFAELRRQGAETEGDFTTDGYSLWPAATPWDLYYAVEALAADRSQQAALIDFILAALPPRGSLTAGNFALPCESVPATEAVAGDGFAAERLLLHYRVATWQESGAPRAVRPAETIRVEMETREVINA